MTIILSLMYYGMTATLSSKATPSHLVPGLPILISLSSNVLYPNTYTSDLPGTFFSQTPVTSQRGEIGFLYSYPGSMAVNLRRGAPTQLLLSQTAVSSGTPLKGSLRCSQMGLSGFCAVRSCWP